MAKQKASPSGKQSKTPSKRDGAARPDHEKALHDLIKRRAPALRELEKR